MLDGCPREREVTGLVERGQWPEAASPEIAAHLRECRSCADLALVADAFQWARANAAGPRNVVAPGLLWWRAQLRRRNAATEQISRPITIAETFALMVTLVLGIGFLASQYNHGLRWASWWSEVTLSRALHLVSMGSSAMNGNLLLLIPGLGMLALIGGLVLYLVTEKS